LVSDIVTEQEEKDFSRYMKKSVATILQMKNSVLYPRSFLDADTKGWVDRCSIQHNLHRSNGRTVLEVLPNDWTLEVADADEGPQVVVYITLSTNNAIVNKYNISSVVNQ
jgi:hypothetical protein